MAGGSPGGRATGRRFPTGGKYVEALQHPDLCFVDPELRHGAVRQSPVLGPRAISGNFASVFSVTARDGRRYAVKCFTREIEAQELRYREISAHLAGLDPAALSQPWPVGFEYLSDGVLLDGLWYPVLKMTWVDGMGLIDWIDDHCRDGAAMADLTRRFAALTADLEAHGIGHGDLQHGNLLVTADGTFRLVDYDGMYVPALRGQLANESGHRNYQSPNRSAADFGPSMDRFSAWVVHLALAATAADPEIWAQLHDSRGEYLLLSEPDFTDPIGSFAWATLLGHRDPAVRDLAMRVQAHLRAGPGAIPPLRVETAPIPGPRSGGGAGTAPGTSVPAAGSPPPSWLADHVAASASGQPAARPVKPTPTPTPTGVGFTGRRPGEVAVALAATVLTLVPVLLFALGLLPAPGVLPAEGGALAAGFGCVGTARRRRAEVRAARQRIATLRGQARPLRTAAVRLRELDARMAASDRLETSREAATTMALRDLHLNREREQNRLTGQLAQQRAGIEARLRDLPAREAALLAEATRAGVEAAVAEALRRVSIHDAEKLSTMGAKTVQALIRAGIHTAADFTGVRYLSGGNSTAVTAHFRLAGGREIRVPGIGEARARVLESWRENLAARARQVAGRAVDPGIRARVRDTVAVERGRLTRDLTEAEARAEQSRAALLARTEAERVRLTDAREAQRAASRRLRADLAQERARHEDAAAAFDRLRAVLASERRAARRGLGTRRYALFVLRGH